MSTPRRPELRGHDDRNVVPKFRAELRAPRDELRAPRDELRAPRVQLVPSRYAPTLTHKSCRGRNELFKGFLLMYAKWG